MLTNYLKRYRFSMLITAAIVVLSLAPMPEMEMLENVSLADKWAHMVMYGVLSLAIWLEYLHSHKQIQPVRITLLAVVMPIMLGGLLEVLQAYATSCRSGEWLDFVADAVGVAIASLMGLAWSHFISITRQ